MIQRIQTIYLFCAAIVAFILLFIPIGTIQGVDGYYTYTAFNVKVIHTDILIISTIFNGLFLILSALLSMGAILFYKKRKIQIRLVNINMIVILAALLFMFVIYPKWIFPSIDAFKGSIIIDYNIWLLFSLFAAVGIFLAKKAILKDEAIVKSTERLR